MHLPRHTLTSHTLSPAFVNAHFCSSATSSSSSSESSSLNQRENDAKQAVTQLPDGVFACATRSGFFVGQACPLKILSRTGKYTLIDAPLPSCQADQKYCAAVDFPSAQGGLSHAAVLDGTSLLVLVGGGRVPRFAPNKVVLWDEEAVEYDRDTVESPKTKTPTSAAAVFDSSDNVDDIDDEEVGASSPGGSTLFSVGREERAREEQGSVQEDTSHSAAASQILTASQESSGLRGLFGQDSQASLGEPASDLEVDDERTSRLQQSNYDVKLSGLSTSTADLEDPFLSDEPIQSHETTGSLQSVVSSPKADLTQSSPQDSKLSSPAPLTEPGVREPDVSPAARKPVKRGREVAEFEFGEAVQGICVRTFQISQHSTSREGKGKGREKVTRLAGEEISSEELGKQTYDGASYGLCSLLVVILQRRAIVFELGPHLDEQSPLAHASATSPSPPSPSLSSSPSSSFPTWGIRKRLQVDIFPGSKGLVSLAPMMNLQSKTPTSALVALPGRQVGHVQLIRVPLLAHKSAAAGTSSIIAAHSTSLASLTLSACGRYLCTASERGTLLRIWSTYRSSSNPPTRSSSGSGIGAGGARSSRERQTLGAMLLVELRRGSDPAKILSVAFSGDNRILAAASDKGTIHFFGLSNLDRDAGLAAAASTVSSSDPTQPSQLHHRSAGASLSALSNRYLPTAINNLASQIPPSMLPTYLKSQWSDAQYRIPLRTFSPSAEDRVHSSSSMSSHHRRRAKGMRGLSGYAADVVGARRTLDEESDGGVETPRGGAGVTRSMEGNWVALKGRIEDVRRGEVGKEEEIFLTWVHASQPAITSAQIRSHGKRTEDTVHIEKTGRDLKGADFHLIAITSSGGWYRVAFDPSPPPGSSSSSSSSSSATKGNLSSSTVLDMYRDDHRSSSQDISENLREDPSLTANQKRCWLVEQHRFALGGDWNES